MGAESSLNLQRDAVAVCVPIVAWDAQAAATLESIVEHSESSAAVLVVGARSLFEQVETTGRSIVRLVCEARHEIGLIKHAIQECFPGDLLLVRPGIRVSAGWLEGLREAALSDATVASATPLSLGDGGVELSDEDRSMPLDELAATVAERSLRLRPKIAKMGPGCVYIRRSALELASPLAEENSLNESFGEMAWELMAVGLLHVLADDVLVEGADRGASDGLGDGFDEGARHSLVRMFAEDDHGSLRRAKNRAQLALRRLSVTIDGRSLIQAVGGTQTYIIELILALARAGDVQVRVLVPPNLSERAADALASLPDLEFITYEQAISEPGLTDVVHRPQQVFTPDDLTLLRLLGERVVIGHQDLIAYHNHSYHRDRDAWHTYRRTTRLALAGADQAIFFSEHARLDALSEDLLPADRTHVVGVGVEQIEPQGALGRRPDGLAETDFLLCLGADYAHKNRPFAIEIFGALRARGWPGQLVLVGPHVPYGSSRMHEQRLLSRDPELAELVIDLGPVDESTRDWLTRNTRALLYPTLFEGYGLLPLEAARAGVPCAFAAQASLSEVAAGAATLIPWDTQASADAVLPLLVPGVARDAHVAELRRLSIPPWHEIARHLTVVYEHALAEPPSEAAPRIWQELDRENYIVRLDADVGVLKQMAQEYQDAYHSLEARVSTGLPLIDERGLLSVEQQRGLMRLAARGPLGAFALKPFGLLGRVGKSRADG